ncbi:G2/mitotic-specific cyclin S13-7-like isoform X1 [Canna indica]|uniref:G2/mitotic-specific cyclin S13-7-like isoform X1 n=1 Tax=Canna indica TaxID=4628 RepID=A0AAQ3Q3T6_9LILI|nr:G2/mitotic-specific cyclin S13-7-like isoform X1 [Canna indica]
MATRRQAVVSQQQRGADVPVGKQKNIALADAKSRRALGDIGNLVNLRISEGKPEPQINRPITRSFGAQLLANAHAAAAAANKKPVPAAIQPAAAVRKGGIKPAKKVSIKPESIEDIIVISPDDNEKPNQATEPSTSHLKNSLKKSCTLTSVLTARSKVACGLAEKPNEWVHDIDAADKEDQLAVVDYVEDIYKFYKSAENSSSLHDYMDSQVEINAKMRAILVDWLIEVHHKFELTPESLYLTMYIIDRYLSMEVVLRRELQLAGVAAMLIASKYEEIWAPEVVNDFICISDRAYTREQILGMEKGILNKLEWNLTVPTPYVFLVRFVKASLCDAMEEHMVFFFAELALMQYSLITCCPSMVAAAAVYAARCTMKKSPLWTETLKCHTGFSEQQLLDCAQTLVDSHAVAPVGKLKVVYKKYSGEQFGAVALHPPATKWLEELKASKK